MIEGASLHVGKERGALPIWGTIPNDLGHRSTSTGVQQDPVPLLGHAQLHSISGSVKHQAKPKWSSIKRDTHRPCRAVSMRHPEWTGKGEPSPSGDPSPCGLPGEAGTGRGGSWGVDAVARL